MFEKRKARVKLPQARACERFSVFAGEKVFARWEDAQYLFNLFRYSYQPTFSPKRMHPPKVEGCYTRAAMMASKSSSQLSAEEGSMKGFGRVLCLALLPILLFLSLPRTAAQTDGRLVLVTYNIHHAEGVDGILSLDRIAEDIRHGDIVGLQEVDNRFGERSRFAHQAELLAQMLNMYFVFAPNLDLDGSIKEGDKIRNVRRQYGNALLSRFPIEYARNYLLPKIAYENVASEQRGLLETQVDIAGKKLRVYVTHLCSTSSGQRLLQVEAIKDLILQARSRGLPQGGGRPADTFVLMGDFNFRPDAEEYRRLAGEFRGGRQLLRSNGFADFWRLVSDAAGHTIGVASAQGERIDYVFVSPDLAKQARSAEVNVRTKASDHQPLTAVLGGF